MSNVDGSGRQIQIIVHPDGIKIRASCFVGTLNEFCNKASIEGKQIYTSVIRAAAEALQQAIIENNITGGWDEPIKE